MHWEICNSCAKRMVAYDLGPVMDWEGRFNALVRRLVEIADTPSATERMVAYDLVARAHEKDLQPTDTVKTDGYGND